MCEREWVWVWVWVWTGWYGCDALDFGDGENIARFCCSRIQLEHERKLLVGDIFLLDQGNGVERDEALRGPGQRLIGLLGMFDGLGSEEGGRDQSISMSRRKMIPSDNKIT